MGESDRVREVYEAYDRSGRSERWAADEAIRVERGSLLRRLLSTATDHSSAAELRVLDLGCGRGELRADILSAGVQPGNLVGVDLIPERLIDAAERGLPVCAASGTALPFRSASFDVVLLFTVLSSVLDEHIVSGIEAELRRVLAPGGAVIVYDMRLPSPTNHAVRPLTARRLDRLFPTWERTSTSCTLLPPLARRVAATPGGTYSALAAVPLLRSHLMSVLQPGRPEWSRPRSTPVAHAAQAGGDPSVTVVMPVRNEGDFIERSLAAVLQQDDVGRLDVVVVDGHSDDGTPHRVAEIAARSAVPVEVIDNPGRIVPISMNLGLERATGDVIVRVDGHCVIAPDYVRRCLDALAATGADCVGGPMATVGETAMARAIAVAQSSRFGVGGVAFRTSVEPGFVDTVAFGAYRRGVFDHIGWFDESFVRNQDDELNLRLTRSGGWIWMDPSIRSTYFSRGTLRGLWRQYHGYGFYKVRVMRKHGTVPSVRHLVPAAFVAGTAAAGVTSLIRRSAWPLAAVIGPYSVALAASSVSAANDSDQEVSSATVAAATVTMHGAYGTGWWAGAWRALQHRRKV